MFYNSFLFKNKLNFLALVNSSVLSHSKKHRGEEKKKKKGTMFRQSHIRRGVATSNLFAPSQSGRWFNPPHLWTVTDLLVPSFFFTAPLWIGIWYYLTICAPMYSHYQEKNYYPSLPYTKEFIHKYKRTQRWRHY